MLPMHPPPLTQRIGLRVLWLLGQTPLRRPLARAAMRQPMFNPGTFGGFTPTARDVFVCSYAKSGTNWMMQLALQALHGGAAEFGHVHELVPWPEVAFRLYADLHDPSPARRVIKTHLDAPLVPIADDARYIVVIRDPKAVFVSSYHFVQGVMEGIMKMDFTPEEWLELFLDPRFALGDWATHTATWWAQREHPAVYLTRFEEMKRDLGGTVDAVLQHLDLELTPAQRAAVLERSGFAWMKAHEPQFAPIRAQLRDTSVKMLRSGQSKSKELIDDAQRARIDAVLSARLEALGSDFPYAERYGGLS